MDQHARNREDFSSPFRRSYLSEDDFESRNSEDVHRVALAAAQAEHDRVRDTALQVYAMNELREAQSRLQQQAEAEEERIRLETARALEETRIRELENAAKRIPKPPPRLPTPPPPPPSPPCPVERPPPPPRQKTPPPAIQQQAPPAPKPFFTPPQPPPQVSQPVFTAPKPIVPELTPLARPRPSAKSAVVHHILPGTERYAEIHKDLKNMRANVDTWIQQFDRETRNSIGDLRRGLRTACGQLVVNPQKAENNLVKNKVLAIIRKTLTGFPSQPRIDPSPFLVSAPPPMEGAQYNAEMPVLFIWILNIFAKAIINQLVNEAGAQPTAAEPIGILTVSIFGQKEFLWRGKPLIDIFMAKMRKVCPVLWGYRGNEKTEGGRTALGWHKDGDSWVDIQIHNNRMMGLGAGYAAICLRDFGRSQAAISPWHPTHYWQSMSVIVNTPPDQTSPTQFMVLKAMIDHKEKSFLKFYGTAALAALRIALVDFPAKQANQSEVAVSALKVLASKLERDHGLQLH